MPVRKETTYTYRFYSLFNLISAIILAGMRHTNQVAADTMYIIHVPIIAEVKDKKTGKHVFTDFLSMPAPISPEKLEQLKTLAKTHQISEEEAVRGAIRAELLKEAHQIAFHHLYRRKFPHANVAVKVDEHKPLTYQKL
jgi:hypothetical protein